MNIIFYGGHYWNKGPWFRKQQFAKRLIDRGHKIFYIESSTSMVRKRKNDENFYFKTRVKKINSKLFVISPSTYFPFPGNYFSRKLSNIKLLIDVNRILKQHNINNYILWFNQLEFSSVLNYVNGTKIFDLADDRPYYSKLANDEKGFRTMMKYVKLAFSNSDISIVSALKIKEKYSKFSNNEIIVIPNGHGLEINKTEYDCPIDKKHINRPIIGFVGTLFRFIDDKLLEFIIKKRPEYSFVFVGPIQSNFPIEKIKKYKNVFLLGEKLRNEIPKYINCFDICLNPFKVHEVNDSVNPVKVYEYLALRKKVVSTEMYSLRKEKISKFITFSKDYEDFLNNIDIMLSNSEKQNISDEDLNNYNWDNLFNQLIQKLNNNNLQL